MSLSGTDRGANNNNTGATSVVVTPASNFAAGSKAVLCLAYDNAGGSGADPFSSITDSVGNAWVTAQAALYDPGAASAGVTLRIFESHMDVAALTTGNTITVSFGAVSVTAKSWTLHEIAPASGCRVVLVASGVNAGAATGTPTVTTGTITNGDMVIGAGASESSNTWAGDGDTSNGNWSTHQTSGAGTGTSGMATTAQRKVVTATATQTYNPTLTSADCILAWAQFAEWQPTSPSCELGMFGV